MSANSRFSIHTHRYKNMYICVCLCLYMSVPWLSALRDPGSKHNLIATSTPSLCLNLRLFLSFLFLFFKILFSERGEEKERGREISICCGLSHSPYWGPGLQPRHVVCRPTLSPLSHTSQGKNFSISKYHFPEK